MVDMSVWQVLIKPDPFSTAVHDLCWSLKQNFQLCLKLWSLTYRLTIFYAKNEEVAAN